MPEVPKNNTVGATPKHALFAGAIWVGGYDGGGQLRPAAQTYRQTGTDFYSGSLDAAADVSAYEQSQLDTRVRITNLPQKVKIKIFTLSGHLVRTLDKDDPTTVIDWDLRNRAGVPVASGVYIFHIDAPGIGEKVLKWFGAMRATDLDAF